jgi:DNA-binding transcriptional ArsR family regulator
MKLKLRLVRDGETLFEIPLSPADWSKEALENELDTTEGDFQAFSKIFDALFHETRLRMMRRLVEADDRTVSFADFMQGLDLNPKIVWENSKKLEESGFLEKASRGKYTCSVFGETTFMMSLALRRLMEYLREIEEL